ncbi:MAG TPA: tubulin-like doman-containing protein [Edaphocola sp.]|nr:tubulin-like doman-containing protein [Edaphocola sp.]
MTTFPKTLIIGLGGLGSDIVVEVFKRFKNHSKHEDDFNKVRFIAMDTDSGEINERRAIMNPEDVIQTSATTNITVGHFLDEIKNDSTVEKWFPTDSPELTQMSINDGAGQIRIVSRLAFSHAVQNKKMDRLEKAISELLSLSAGEGNIIEVHIVTSTAGGTGAGSLLQTAFLVREILRRNNISNPKVWGYFLLGDVFLRDPSVNLSDPTKMTNVLANTYASIKELNGIFEIKPGDEIEFEYGKFSANPTVITKDNSIPFNQVFLYDFENNDGNNLKYIRNYSNQIAEFLYLNAFSPAGSETRSRAINEIFRQIEQGSASRYGSTGISKIVYPVDNLLQYFTVRRLADNLKSTWQKIDYDYEKLHNEWRIDTNKGIFKKEPVLGEFFMSNVDALAQNGMGTEQVIFKSIWQSTKIKDPETQDILGSKTEYFLQEVIGYLKGLIDANADINALAKVQHNESFTSKVIDESNDRTNIKQVEDQLEALQKEVFNFIDENKSLALEEIFANDINSHGYFIEEARHRINGYILEKGRALHPLAMRYFFYDLLQQLEDNAAILKEKNDKRLAFISQYKDVYDIKEGNGPDTHIETALEAYDIYRNGSKSMISLFAKITGKSTELADFKTEYVRKSKNQARVLQDFALERLEEYVFNGLITQIKKMIDNLELLFKAIPNVLISLNNEQNALVNVTDSGSGNPSVINILSGIKHRSYIYDEVIAKKDTIFLPEDISRNIYEELYSRTVQQLSSPLHYVYDRMEERINNIFNKLVVKKQKQQLFEDFKNDFAGYNIIEAMRKQAELDGVEAISFMNQQCRNAERMATPFGAKYDATASKINSWALHPECVEYQNLTPENADQLFNNPGSRQNNANRIISDYFDRTEIIREDSVLVLSVPANYLKFAPLDMSTVYSSSIEGIYYTYYKKRIKEIQEDNNLPTPHLDKRWNNPRFFRDLGVNRDTYEKNITRAFIYGLTAGNIVLIDHQGTQTWGYSTDRGIAFMLDDTGKTIKSNVKKLLLESLWNNEQLIDSLNTKFDSQIEKSKSIWEQIRMDGKSMLSMPLLSKIKNFNFTETGSNKNDNILSIFSGYLIDTQNDSMLINLVLEILIETIIAIAGNNGATVKEQTLSIISNLIEGIKESEIPLTRTNVDKFFENKIDKYFS